MYTEIFIASINTDSRREVVIYNIILLIKIGSPNKVLLRGFVMGMKRVQ